MLASLTCRHEVASLTLPCGRHEGNEADTLASLTLSCGRHEVDEASLACPVVGENQGTSLTLIG